MPRPPEQMNQRSGRELGRSGVAAKEQRPLWQRKARAKFRAFWFGFTHPFASKRQGREAIERIVQEEQPFHLESLDLVPGEPFPLAYVWECPRCHSQIGQVPPEYGVTFGPPTCTHWTHPDEAIEMEQRNAERFGRQWESPNA